MSLWQVFARPADFVRPDYAGGGLINLMSTLAAATGAGSSYPPLDPRFGLAADDLAKTRRIVLVIIDGLGDVLLDPDLTPTLCAHRVGKLTSVFPTTTASAVTSLLTALAPAQHGLTGWHMWFREIGRILAVLPLVPRGPRTPGWKRDDLPAQLFAHQPLSARVTRRHVTVSPVKIADSPFNNFHTVGSTSIAHHSPAEFFPLLATTVLGGDDAPAYVHAYLPDLDELLHETGPDDPSVRALLRALDASFALFLKHIAGSGATVIVTADHGFIAAPARHTIDLDQHPELAAMLERPLCGERRVAYAYVRAGRTADFEAYVERHLAKAIRLVRSGDFIAEGWFGPEPRHPELASRVGDYVLLMKDDWTIRDWMDGEHRYEQRGVHAGASAAEMWIPLIVART